MGLFQSLDPGSGRGNGSSLAFHSTLMTPEDAAESLWAVPTTNPSIRARGGCYLFHPFLADMFTVFPGRRLQPIFLLRSSLLDYVLLRHSSVLFCEKKMCGCRGGIFKREKKVRFHFNMFLFVIILPLFWWCRKVLLLKGFSGALLFNYFPIRSHLVWITGLFVIINFTFAMISD